MKLKTLALVLLALLAVGIFAGYHFLANPGRTIIPTDATVWDKELAPSIAKLSEDDKRLAAAYLVRKKLSEAFGGKQHAIPPGLTLAKAITEERNLESAEAAKDAEAKALETRVTAERQAVAKRINDLLTVALINKSFLPSDYKSGNVRDSIQIELAFENKGKKDITGVKGKTIFKDIFGDVIKVVNLSYDEGIPAGKYVYWNGSLNYNQFEEKDVKLRSVEMTKLQFSFEPEVVIFNDGTRISPPDAPQR